MTTETLPEISNTMEETVDDLALHFSTLQGLWTEEQYLRLTDDTNRLVEFTDGYIEVLPIATDNHQTVLLFFYEVLLPFIRKIGGKMLIAPLRVRMRQGKYREPDLLFVRDKNDPRRQNRFWLGADFALEVVSPNKPARDLEDKPSDYAEAGIPEYWIVNPINETITVLRLDDDAYTEHGVFQRGDTATAATLDGFSVSVDAVFDAE